MEPRAEVKSFAEEMEKQLRANEHKGGWNDCTARHLLDELHRNYRNKIGERRKKKRGSGGAAK